MQNVGELSLLHRSQLLRHFLALGSEDRRLRPGIAPSDSAVRTYVARIDLDREHGRSGGASSAVTHS